MLQVYRAIRRREEQADTALAYEVGDKIFVTEETTPEIWEGVCNGHR